MKRPPKVIFDSKLVDRAVEGLPDPDDANEVIDDVERYSRLHAALEYHDAVARHYDDNQ